MLPYFFRHYDPFVDKYFVFDNGSTDRSIAILQEHGSVEISHFDVHGDSFVEEERRLGDTIWRGSQADWVIVTDIDEHIYHPDLPAYLNRCRRQGVTAIQSIGFEMVSDRFPVRNRRLVDFITRGTRSVGHDRLCIFDPRAITSTNYSPGRHEASPQGRVLWPEYPEVLLLHYKQLGIEYLVARSAELRRGLRKRDLEQGWGYHYSWDAAKIAENWRELKEGSGPVPGLGSLKHLKPEKYCLEERTIRNSGLVDSEWYLATYPDIQDAQADPVLHYCAWGWKEGRNPNFYFDAEWYREHYPQLCSPDRNPLYDYFVRGEKKNASPSSRFDTGWYRASFNISKDESPLRHYLLHRKECTVSPLPDFDPVLYCQSRRKSRASVVDPFEEYERRKRTKRRKNSDE